MARQKNIKCADCGDLMYGGKRVLPEGLARCTPCRRKTQKPIRMRKDGQPIGSGPQVFVCQRCDQPWQRQPARGQVPKWCPSCRHMAGYERRRANIANAFVADVNRTKVFVADGYRCHLCGNPTDKTKRVPHPMAPTIDHVIPLSVGGTHEPLNCRTAHYRCNTAKNNRGGGEQLLLLAV